MPYLYHVYKHFKGNYYYVEDFALDSETQETKVCYRELYGSHKLWVRSPKIFTEELPEEQQIEFNQKHRYELWEGDKIW